MRTAVKKFVLIPLAAVVALARITAIAGSARARARPFALRGQRRAPGARARA